MNEVKDKRIDIYIYVDAKLQNEILTKWKLKKINKAYRELSFGVSRRTMCRDFLWHIRRIHHWWNCAMKAGVEADRKPLEIKVGT